MEQFTIENFTSEHTTDDPVEQSDCSLYQTVVCLFLVAGICTFGLAGNITSFFVFLWNKVDSVALLQLRCICVSDSLLLIGFLFVYTVPAAIDHSTSFSPPYVHYVWPLAMMAHTLTIGLTMLVTLTRYNAVCHPQTSYIVHHKQKAYTNILLVVFFSVVFNIPRFFEHNPISNVSITEVNSTDLKPIYLGDHVLYKAIYANLAYFLVMYIMPLFSLGYLNFKLIQALRRNSIRRGSLLRQVNSIGKKAKDDHITLCIIIIVCVFILCQTPALVNQILWAVLPHRQRLCGNFHFYYTRISDVLVVLNSSGNIIIYSLCGSSFRKIFRRTFQRIFVCNSSIRELEIVKTTSV